MIISAFHFLHKEMSPQQEVSFLPVPSPPQIQGCVGAGMLQLCELQVLPCVCVVERDREVVGKLACH